jgi:hypothetical protein
MLVHSRHARSSGNAHRIGVHALADQELVVLEVGNNLLGEALRALLESGDLVGALALLRELCLDSLHVTCGR